MAVRRNFAESSNESYLKKTDIQQCDWKTFPMFVFKCFFNVGMSYGLYNVFLLIKFPVFVKLLQIIFPPLGILLIFLIERRNLKTKFLILHNRAYRYQYICHNYGYWLCHDAPWESNIIIINSLRQCTYTWF